MRILTRVLVCPFSGRIGTRQNYIFRIFAYFEYAVLLAMFTETEKPKIVSKVAQIY